MEIHDFTDRPNRDIKNALRRVPSFQATGLPRKSYSLKGLKACRAAGDPPPSMGHKWPMKRPPSLGTNMLSGLRGCRISFSSWRPETLAPGGSGKPLLEFSA